MRATWRDLGRVWMVKVTAFSAALELGEEEKESRMTPWLKGGGNGGAHLWNGRKGEGESGVPLRTWEVQDGWGTGRQKRGQLPCGHPSVGDRGDFRAGERRACQHQMGRALRLVGGPGKKSSWRRRLEKADCRVMPHVESGGRRQRRPQ